MIYYLDTSALVKRYYTEKGSRWVHALFHPDHTLVVSKVAYAEFLAALARKKREQTVQEADFTQAVESFQHEWQEFVVVEVTDAIFADLPALVQRHPLRGFDAVHLCSAVWFWQRIKADVHFICADRALLTAAEGEGLRTGNPELQDDGEEG